LVILIYIVGKINIWFIIKTMANSKKQIYSIAKVTLDLLFSMQKMIFSTFQGDGR